MGERNAAPPFCLDKTLYIRYITGMILTLKLKLQTNENQKKQLLETMEAFNAACNYNSDVAHEKRVMDQIGLHKLCYYKVREKFGLSAQMAIRAIGKVKEAYKRDKKKHHQFREHGAVVYDHRIWKFKQADIVNLKTLTERIDIPFVFGDYRTIDINRVRGQADLIYRDGVFYFYICVEVPEPPQGTPDDYLGVDLGIVNIATTSDGESFSGNKLNNVRARYASLRTKLQAKGTKSAKHLLKKRKRKETRFQRDVNHCISKQIVEQAKRTGRGIAVEDLKGIRDRIRVRKSQRRVQHSWSFYDLRAKLEYKSLLAGIKLVAVDPRYTSQMCSRCGYISRSNRKTQSTFSCTSCNFSANADVNAAINIGRRAVVNQPNVVSVEAKAPRQLLLLGVNCGGA